MNILRRLPLSRLLLACAGVIAIGASVTAIAFALGSAPTPPAKPLPQAVHDALTAAPVEGVSASVKLTDNLVEGADLASGGGEASQLSQSPLLSGASGRLWIAKDGRVRLELQAEKGDTQVLYDGKTVTVYDASTNTLYRYTPPAHPASDDASQTSGTVPDRSTTAKLQTGDGAANSATDGLGVAQPEIQSSGADATDKGHGPPSVAKIEEAISKLAKHANVSGATPSDVAGQPAYTVRVSPKESGSLIGGAELSWDAVHGVPLRAALYSSTSSAPVIELAASDVSYGPVDSSVFDFTAPAGAKVVEVTPPSHSHAKQGGATSDRSHPNISSRGHGVTSVGVLESKTKPGDKPLNLPEGLQKVHLGGVTATELPTALGTLLSFERSGVRYLLVGAVSPQAIEAVARGL
jgi:outer membrane lipoprotein-sorting protein